MTELFLNKNNSQKNTSHKIQKQLETLCVVYRYI
jgi:hypothetical protein